MSLEINTLSNLNIYLNGVMHRADHHGDNVNKIVLILAGAVIWKAKDSIEVRTYNNETANMLWLTVNGSRYAFVYNHNTGNIEMRNRTLKGELLAWFNNETSADEVKEIFSKL